MSSAVNDSLVGRELDGRYRVLSRVAEGGMATVYVAVDSRLEREIALKVMRPSLAEDEAFVSRFRREARSAARLSHPHVVAVYDQGEDQGQVFLAMEYVPGQTLRQVLNAEGPLTPRAALDIIDPVLQALSAAHRAGIIHRDVKPENVILREDGMVKVADFGLARAISSQTNTSATGMLLGTVAYLSPEQVERGIADARSDVYAAGLVLFEMLTGEKAFTGDTPIHVAYQHVHGSVPVPSSRLATISPALDALIAHATSRDPDGRPADAAAFLAEVRRVHAELSPAELDSRPDALAPGGEPRVTGDITRTAALPIGHRPQPQAPPQTVAAGGPGDEQTRRARIPRSRHWRWIAAAIAAVLVVSLGIWFFAAGPGASTVVPRVVGQNYTQAHAALSKAHLRADRVDAFDETVARGLVISTNPGGGKQVSRSTRVTVTVSKGPERYAVPRLVGASRDEAVARLTKVKLVVGKVTEAYDDKVPQGQVAGSNPGAGRLLKRGTAVDLVISKGRQPIEVQDFTGKPVGDAVNALTGLGLKVNAEQQQFDPNVPKGSVISQTPPNGTLFKGDTVTLVVSKGPDLAEVPDVLNKHEGEATDILKAAGFNVAVNKIFGGHFDTVRAQDPPAHSQQPKGSTITITIV